MARGMLRITSTIFVALFLVAAAIGLQRTEPTTLKLEAMEYTVDWQVQSISSESEACTILGIGCPDGYLVDLTIQTMVEDVPAWILVTYSDGEKVQLATAGFQNQKLEERFRVRDDAPRIQVYLGSFGNQGLQPLLDAQCDNGCSEGQIQSPSRLGGSLDGRVTVSETGLFGKSAVFEATLDAPPLEGWQYEARLETEVVGSFQFSNQGWVAEDRIDLTPRSDVQDLTIWLVEESGGAGILVAQAILSKP